MRNMLKIDSPITEQYEMRSSLKDPTNIHKKFVLVSWECSPSLPSSLLLFAISHNDQIGEALRILESEDWESAKPFLKPWGPQQVTPVHLAAYRGKLLILQRAADLHADLNATDFRDRVALHYAAAEGHVNVVSWLLERSTADGASSEIPSLSHPQLSQRDSLGMTALHIAVIFKHVNIVKLLADAGADVDACEGQGFSPIVMAHFGVRRSNSKKMSQYENLVDILMSANASVHSVHPITRWTALYYAVALGSHKATKRLLENGANPENYGKNSADMTPLHLAATKGYHQTIHILLKYVKPQSINITDMLGCSPLHYAILFEHPKCIQILIDKGGNLAKKNKFGTTAIDMIRLRLGDTAFVAYFTDVLDERVSLEDVDYSWFTERKTAILNFEILAPEGQPQTAVVSALMKGLSGTELRMILQHPLLEAYLGIKWSHLRRVFNYLVTFHIVFVICLSCYAIAVVLEDVDSYCPTIRRMLLCTACISLCHVFMQCITEPKHYLGQFENWLSLISVTISVVVSVAGEFINNAKASLWILYSISVAILLACTQMMLLIGRFPAWGFYALIFSSVLKHILKILFIGFWIIAGFALSFFILFHGNYQFDNPWKAFMKTTVMMTGEYEWDDLIARTDKNNSTARSFASAPVVGGIVFLLFVILASIVLMNLMIGLAVSDIQGLLNKGQFTRLLKQGEFIANCERISTMGIFRNRFVPRYLRQMLESTIDTKKIVKFGSRELGISKKLEKNIFTLCFRNKHPDKRSRCKNIEETNAEVKRATEDRCATIESSLHRLVIELQLQNKQLQRITQDRNIDRRRTSM